MELTGPAIARNDGQNETEKKKMIRTTRTDEPIGSPFAAFTKLLVATRYADDAEPNRIGCRCSCPACRADDCMKCVDDR